MSDLVSGIDFPNTDYVLKQKAVRNAYKLYDTDENEILSSKQKLLKAKEDFPFKDPEGNEVFRVKAENVLDIAGDYALIDSESGEKFAVLKKNFTLLTHSWEIQSTDKKTLATVTSRGKVFGLLRSLHELMELLPHKYTIEDADGAQIGSIEERFSLRDRYDITVDKGVEGREAIIAAVAVIDALEGN